MKLNESLGLRKTLAFKVEGVNRRYIFTYHGLGINKNEKKKNILDFFHEILTIKQAFTYFICCNS